MRERERQSERASMRALCLYAGRYSTAQEETTGILSGIVNDVSDATHLYERALLHGSTHEVVLGAARVSVVPAHRGGVSRPAAGFAPRVVGILAAAALRWPRSGFNHASPGHGRGAGAVAGRIAALCVEGPVERAGVLVGSVLSERVFRWRLLT